MDKNVILLVFLKKLNGNNCKNKLLSRTGWCV
ncbi:Hypothetical Protein SLY_0266 [Strawberry lethal yellows phytoplasma (CPA) str. NZSb11]|uniref:Uncharacterized protein n=1 Tax=Strawberry lethal yellows phytoplasma (CPA) str. NZSb11 TaxID=980422 RepID=R4S0A5_PHYAS|nr:Hypothetical Protein SLY_0266 [Strawberry lethal yellows phytoplasma (CPA) str. NZSb11]